jgi:hypothetical protein
VDLVKLVVMEIATVAQTSTLAALEAWKSATKESCARLAFEKQERSTVSVCGDASCGLLVAGTFGVARVRARS